MAAYASAEVGGGYSNTSQTSTVENALGYELTQLEGYLGQDPETGRKVDQSFLAQYTNRLFGAPFQLLDSVDKRFDNINRYVGNEYLRNFMLNSPILSIRPGMPRYTGNKDPSDLMSGIKNVYWDVLGGDSVGGAIMNELAKNLIFGHGAKLQRRMYGFRETYFDYMQHVNYMCRSVAIFLNLTESNGEIPTGCFMSTADGSSDAMTQFIDADWSNYRMMGNSIPIKPFDYLCSLLGVVADEGKNLLTQFLGTSLDIAGFSLSVLGNILMDETTSAMDTVEGFLGLSAEDRAAAYEQAHGSSIGGVMKNKVACVQFMVEPLEFSETLTNQAEPSVVEKGVDSLTNSVGYELAWITNSNADFGYIEGLLGFMGDVTATALTTASGLMRNVTGGFLDNVFNGAIRSIKGQKMIYPEIYKSSKSTMNYNFSVTLSSPYGDVYNYYMNIIVPLMHLIALAAPRMVTANTITSPYIIQAYLPGMATCQMGLIENMVITKNPTTKHVSVNGFPLTVKVTFTVKELYNALSISPIYDPSSFLFNETLNDYMANLAGLIPSIDTYTKQREAMFANLDSFANLDGFANAMASPMVEWAENKISPFT